MRMVATASVDIVTTFTSKISNSFQNQTNIYVTEEIFMSRLNSWLQLRHPTCRSYLSQASVNLPSEISRVR